jgi:hypothetical protein
MNTEKVHISLITSGDTIFHNNKEMTVCNKDIKRGFNGITIFGDSYRLGKVPVLRVIMAKIKKCCCGEEEFLQVLPVFNKYKVHCVNCGNRSQAMSTPEKTIESWNTSNRFNKDNCQSDKKSIL